MNSSAFSLIISCEHAGNEVPEKYRPLFNSYNDVLTSHLGWDPGAWEIAEFISIRNKAPLFGCFTTRLLIEANRSLDNPQLFSAYVSTLSQSEKKELIDSIYTPYRASVLNAIKTQKPPVLHLSMHSFTPVLNGNTREVDIGLLFDPSRNGETSYCETVLVALQEKLPGLRLKFNEPYKGIEDGFTTHLRAIFSDHQYLGIEVEVNQKLLDSVHWIAVKKALHDVLTPDSQGP